MLCSIDLFMATLVCLIAHVSPDDNSDTFVVVQDDQKLSSESDDSSDEKEMDEAKVQRVKSVLRREDVHSKFERLKKLRAQGANRTEGPTDQVRYECVLLGGV